MLIKLILNTLLTIGIVVLILSLFWTFNQGYYPLMVGALVALAMLVYLKLRLIKSVRELTRKR